MSREWGSVNQIYISERMQESLRHIQESDMTAIIAPMGYGKTTAVNWYLEEQEKAGNAVLRISIYSDYPDLFWKSFQRAFQNTPAGSALTKMKLPIGRTAAGMLTELLLDTISRDKRKYFLFIDDFHLMNQRGITELLLLLARNVPNLHLLIASREHFLSRSEEMWLGRGLYTITVNDLRLNPTEISIYSRRCGVSLSDKQLRELNNLCEGWFSAVYLNLKSFAENGFLLTESQDIYEMLYEALIVILSPEEQKFLLCTSLTDEFTLEQAEFLTENKEAERIASRLIKSNAFVRLLPDGKNYRLHHMLKECMNRRLTALPLEEQKKIYRRCGIWQEKQQEYMQAALCYIQSGDNTDVLRIIELDAGVQLAAAVPERVLHWLDHCTDQELMTNPVGLLVLMRRLFSWREIGRMLIIKGIFLKAVKEKDFPEEERNNLLGECDLIMSFLGYNDIAAMSRLQQRACMKMTRNAISIQSSSSYTFGSPSILMMFHRVPGKMMEETETMKKVIPLYNKVTDNHGAGADLVMMAESLFYRGLFIDAQIALEKAKAEACVKERQFLLLCCDFLSQRMNLIKEQPFDSSWYEKRREELKSYLDPTLLTTLDGCEGYIGAITGITRNIPEWLAEGRLDSVNLLHPARPMYEIIYNQILLETGEYARLIGRGEQLRMLCGTYPYTLCLLYLHIQLAGAYEALKKHSEARSELKNAAEIGIPDHCVVPFAENFWHIEPLMNDVSGEFWDEIRKIAARILRAREQTSEKRKISSASENLTPMEMRICRLIDCRKTNREIAAELFFSEGTVKQYINQIYSKLGIQGNIRDKRKRLSFVLFEKDEN